MPDQQSTGRFSFTKKGLDRKWRWLIAVVGLVLAWYALQGVAWTDVRLLLMGLRPSAIFIILGINLLLVPLMSARWWLLLKTLGTPISLLALSGYRLAAGAVSYFTPGPHFGGEPVSIYLLQLRHGIPAVPAITSVAVDRLLEMVTSLIVLGLCFTSPVFLGHGNFGEQQGAMLLIGTLAVLFLTALFSGRRPLSNLYLLATRLRHSFFPTQTGKKSPLLQTLAESEGYAEAIVHSSPLSFLLANLLSLAHWAGVFIEFSIMCRFLGSPLSLAQLVALVATARLSFYTPLPAGLGILELALPWLTTTMGSGSSLGISICLIIRLRDILFGVAGLGLTMNYLTCRQKVGIINDPNKRQGYDDLLE